MTIESEIQSLEPDAKVDLYVFDFNPIGEATVYRYYSGVDVNYGDIAYQGFTYTPWPLVIEGLEKQGTGPQNRPTLTLSNVTGYMTGLSEAKQDLIGIKVMRIRTLAKYLDGAPGADPSAYGTEVYYVDRKKAESKIVIQFELASAIDFMNKQLPGRLMIANTCPWGYTGTECSWPGTDSNKWYDRNGDQVFTQVEDVCGKRLVDCELRFGEAAELPYGGFPALGRV